MLYLARQSRLVLHALEGHSSGTQASLSVGTLVFTASHLSALEILADSAHIRAAVDTTTVGQVTVIGPKTLYIYARQGALLFSYEDETEVIPEGKAYRVTLDPPDDDSTMAAGKPGTPQRPAQNANRRHRGFLLVLLEWVRRWARLYGRLMRWRVRIILSAIVACAAGQVHAHWEWGLWNQTPPSEEGGYRVVKARNASSFWAAAPEERAASAWAMPSRSVVATPAASKAAAALIATMSRRGPVSPAKIRRSMAALSAGSPPRMACGGARFTPKCSGVTV
jgi:hypothetical protein